MVEFAIVSDFDEHEVKNLKNLFVNSDWARFGDYVLVGNDAPTNDLCGKFRSHYVCLNVEKHKGKEWNGQNCTNKVFARAVLYSCRQPSCSVCYEDWCSRQAWLIECRLKEVSKRFGLVEHLSASVPHRLFGADMKTMRKYITDALKRRGIIGACLIFHGFRYRRFDVVKGGILYPLGWYWSPHFHVLGFIKGGYGRCRKCKNQKCFGYGNFNQCDGFEAVTRHCFEHDGVIVKVAVDKFGVKSERKSVFHTAQYILSHASIRTNVKRSHAYSWFGVVSYRKLKVVIPKRKFRCPICGEELKRGTYTYPAGLFDYNHHRFITNSDDPNFRKEFLDDYYLGNGFVGWVETPSGSYGRFNLKTGRFESESLVDAGISYCE